MVRPSHSLFRREIIGGRTFEFKAMQVYQQVTIPAGTRGPWRREFDFSAQPGTADATLVDLDEDELVRRAVHFPEIREMLLGHLGFDPRSTWCLLGAKRPRLLPSDRGGRPGDFDLICGPVRQGKVAFDFLGEIEVKKLVVRGSRDVARRASGTGTTQARLAASSGFDVVSLVHFVVGEPVDLPPGYASSWAPIVNTDFGDPMERTWRDVQRFEHEVDDAPYGFALLGWGQPMATSPEIVGALCPVHVRDAPVRPFRDDRLVRARASELRENLSREVGPSRPAAPILLSCPRCHTIFEPRDRAQSRCCK